MDEFSWTDVDEIGYRLAETHPDVDPLSVRFTDFAESPDHEAEAVRYITRWRLEKKRPRARLSDPVKPDGSILVMQALSGGLGAGDEDHERERDDR